MKDQLMLSLDNDLKAWKDIALMSADALAKGEIKIRDMEAVVKAAQDWAWDDTPKSRDNIRKVLTKLSKT